MYSETLNVANKIISDSDLSDIFQRMYEEIQENNKQSENEKIQNERFETAYQKWTIKDFVGSFKCNINFYDATEIEIDNYASFSNVFNNRLHEIKHMWVRCQYSYSKGEGYKLDYVNKHIFMDIYEHKMNIDVKITSDDNKMENIYNLIKEKIMVSPEKYDRIIRNKSSITNKVGISVGMIPSIIICLLLLISPQIRMIYGNTFVGFPVVVMVLSFIIGGVIANMMLGKYYEPLNPEKKYAGYDSSANKSIYKDDIEKYVETSEIIIGKNIDNIKNRKSIAEIESKYSGYLKYEIIALVVLSIIVLIISKLV